MMRPFASTRGSTGDEMNRQPVASERSPSWSGLLRKLLLVTGVAVLAYAASRRAGFRKSVPSMDAVREKAPVGSSETSRQMSIDEALENEPGESTTAEDEGAEEMPGEDLSTEEIVERAEEDPETTPKEPGEMQVDEEVVEDIVDEDETMDEDEERT